MDFTYTGYRNLISALGNSGYSVANYHNYEDYSHCVILRHDIDTSIADAVRVAEIENELGVSSTYFVLLRTDAYNPASAESGAYIKRIQNLGHEIGLHFDEKAYDAVPFDPQVWIEKIKTETDILSDIIETPVSTVSMHRPSKEMLMADLQLPGIVNSYGNTFFKGFKYLSDSRRHWREPAMDIIKSRQYNRLHILTHAFWYKPEEEDMQATIKNYVQSANGERYRHLADNITDLSSILPEDSF